MLIKLIIKKVYKNARIMRIIIAKRFYFLFDVSALSRSCFLLRANYVMNVETMFANIVMLNDNILRITQIVIHELKLMLRYVACELRSRFKMLQLSQRHFSHCFFTAATILIDFFFHLNIVRLNILFLIILKKISIVT